MQVTEVNKRNPNICRALKLHRNPTKKSFTIIAPKCSMRPLLKPVTAALKVIYKQIEYYYFKT